MGPLVLLATCRHIPALDQDDRPLLRLLAARGVRAQPAVWNDPDVDWADADLVVVRSTWDYHDDRETFLTWAGNLRCVANPADVLRWNTDKTYLRELAHAGLPVVETHWVGPGEPYEPPSHEHVVKPSVSVGSKDTARYAGTDRAASLSHVQNLQARGKTAMVQPYVASIDARGETGLVFVDGSYSHAFRKGALLRVGAGLVEGLYAAENIEPGEASGPERELGEAVIDALPVNRRDLLYARVDLIEEADGSPAVLEVELTEPSLYLATADGATERFADAIAQRCSTSVNGVGEVPVGLRPGRTSAISKRSSPAHQHPVTPSDDGGV